MCTYSCLYSTYQILVLCHSWFDLQAFCGRRSIHLGYTLGPLISRYCKTQSIWLNMLQHFSSLIVDQYHHDTNDMLTTYMISIPYHTNDIKALLIDLLIDSTNHARPLVDATRCYLPVAMYEGTPDLNHPHLFPPKVNSSTWRDCDLVVGQY